MTEEQARKKYCPVATLAITGQGGWCANRNFDGSPLVKCIASSCMLWNSDVTHGDGVTYDQGGKCGLINS